MINAAIMGVGRYIPTKRLSNDDLSKMMETSDEWIRTRTGISARHVATGKETTAFMGEQAARQALANANIAPADVDMIIVSTVSPDYPDCPATANIIQAALGAEEAAAYDIKAACSGFVYGLEQARGFVQIGYKNIVVMGVERLTSISDWEDRSSTVLFGDGAGAAVVSAAPAGGGAIRDTIIRSQGKDADALPFVRKKSMTIDGKQIENRVTLKIDGKRVYDFAVDVSHRIVNKLIERNNLKIDDIKWIVSHQANERIIKATAKRAGIPFDKFFINIAEYANTSGATIPIALSEMAEQGLIVKGDTVILVGFGGGLTYGGTLITW